jgi:Peptidase family M23/Transglycosylase SLT domain/NlpC/P60 family
VAKLAAALLAATLTLVLAPVLIIGLITASILAPVTATTIACHGSLGSSGDWRVPFVDTSYTISSGFGIRLHPVRQVWALHNGVDLAAPATAVVAASTGSVTAAGWDTAFGNRIIIDHGKGVSTLYGHLAQIDPTIRVGESVRIGQPLGMEGATGYATGIHLHFTITIDGTDIDPVPFMHEHGAPLNGQPVAATSTMTIGDEGGIGFDLPPPTSRRVSLTNPPTPIPAGVLALYQAAATRYRLPWTLLAGIGMEETNHGRNSATSSAGAQGLMQFMPATFAAYAVDGNADGRTSITDPADSIYTAAAYLVVSAALRGPDGIRSALYAYNHVDWYVGDVLYYAHAYGGGQVLAGSSDCGPGTGDGNPALGPVSSARLQIVLDWAHSKLGGRYVLGAGGPDAYDCSSFVKAAYSRINITMPRTAQEQRDWLAAGNGYRIPLGQEQPGDLIFIDSYLGPRTIGHVAIVWNPTERRTIEAANTRQGVILGHYTGYVSHTIFQIWRVANIAG